MPGITTTLPSTHLGLGSVAVRLALDRDRAGTIAFAPGDALAIPGQPPSLWVNAALRVDGDLLGRVRERLLATGVDQDAQRAALAVLVDAEPRLRAQMRTLRGMAELAAAARRDRAGAKAAAWPMPARGRESPPPAWDPRLDEALALAEAMRAAFGDAAPLAAPAFAPARLLDEVQRESGGERRTSPQIEAARAAAPNLGGSPWVELHVVLLELARRLRPVADHAAGIAGRTPDVEIAARYRALAEACNALAAAAVLVTDP